MQPAAVESGLLDIECARLRLSDDLRAAYAHLTTITKRTHEPKREVSE
jgi:hypothetical protein